MLTTASYVPDQDTHVYRSQVTNEVTGGGYGAGGVALVNKSITYSAAGNVGKLDADDLSWPGSTIVGARVLVIYDDTPVSNNLKPLLFYGVFDNEVTTSDAILLINFDSAGIVTWAAS
jgi:hypothetical protein